jgi:hypothetical protein
MVQQKYYESPTEIFIDEMTETFRGYDVSADIARLEAIGMTAVGCRYFEDLYQPDEEVAAEFKLASIVVGCTAKGNLELATEARDRLFAITGHTQSVHEWLGRQLIGAKVREKEAGGISAASRLRQASKELDACRNEVVPFVDGQNSATPYLIAIPA